MTTSFSLRQRALMFPTMPMERTMLALRAAAPVNADACALSRVAFSSRLRVRRSVAKPRMNTSIPPATATMPSMGCRMKIRIK